MAFALTIRGRRDGRRAAGRWRRTGPPFRRCPGIARDNGGRV